jgi:hypothetical protein
MIRIMVMAVAFAFSKSRGGITKKMPRGYLSGIQIFQGLYFHIF